MISNDSISNFDKNKNESSTKVKETYFSDSINKKEKYIIKEKENSFFEKIQELNTFIQILQNLQLTEYINMPRICCIGNQSSGKTSLLTNIIGLDILPKGDRIITRRPIELKLNQIKSGKSYIFFDEDKNDIITDFSTVKEKIKKLTNSFCGYDKNIKDKPLIINIFSSNLPKFNNNRFTRDNKSSHW